MQEDRLEILSALSSKLQLDDDVRLEELAIEAEHFTGADLQAVLYTAQLKAIHQQRDAAAGDDYYECLLFFKREGQEGARSCRSEASRVVVGDPECEYGQKKGGRIQSGLG